MTEGRFDGFPKILESPTAAGGPERSPHPSRFQKIQQELHAIVLESIDELRPLNNDELDRIKALKTERAPIINKANQIGLFETLDRQAREDILNAEDPDHALATISDIDTENLEIEATGNPGWSDDFRGMLDEQKGIYLALVQRAEAKAHNDPTSSDDYIHRDRVLNNCSWGTLPVTLAENLAKKSVLQKQAQTTPPPAQPPAQPALNSRDLAKEIARAQGLQPPEAVLEEFRDGEENLKPTQAIVPGSEPRFWVIIDKQERLRWYVRSTINIAGYKKNLAGSTDKLYMDEMREKAVELNKTALKRIFTKEAVLPGVGIYTTIIGDQRFRGWSHEKDLYTGKGHEPTDINYKKVFCDAFSHGRDTPSEKVAHERILTKLISDYGEANMQILRREEGELRETCADSFYPHDISWGTPIEEASFRALKESVRHWFMTKGRDLLLTEEEKNDRKAFFEGRMLTEEEIMLDIDPESRENWGRLSDSMKQEEMHNIVFRMMQRRARDAEQIAWNFAYDMDILETFDSRDFRPAGTTRHAPSSFWSLATWVPMHLQERFEAKIRRTLGFEVEIREEEDEKTKKPIKTQDVYEDYGTNKTGSVKAGAQYDILDSAYDQGKEWVRIGNSDGEVGWINKDKVSELRDVEPKEIWTVLGPWGVHNIIKGGLREPPRIRILGEEGQKVVLRGNDLKDYAGKVEARKSYTYLESRSKDNRIWYKVRGPDGVTGWIESGKTKVLKGKFRVPDNLRVCPNTVIRGPLFTPRYEGKTAESATLFAVFNKIGADVLNNPTAYNTVELYNRINWKGMKDSPFVPFIFDEMRWADVIQNVVKKGDMRDSRVTGAELTEAVINLRLTRRQRDILMMLYISGVNPNVIGSLDPPINVIGYKGRRDGFMHENPDYYYELPPGERYGDERGPD